jgi:DNA-directed RNA polymerase specialized sigma24 family protein
MRGMARGESLVVEDPAHAFARTLDDARTTVLLDPRRDFGAVYEAHYQQIFKAVRGVVLNATLAEDVTQDAFVKAYQARDNYRPTGRVEAWLCTIAIREAISRLRWTALQRRLVAFWQRDIESQVSGEGLPERVEELLAVLSPKTRARSWQRGRGLGRRSHKCPGAHS